MPPVKGQVADALVQPDGKGVVLLVGVALGSMVLARTLPDGALDPTFGAGGKRFVQLPNQGVIARALARQQDGKLLAVGSAQHPGPLRLLVARLDGNGTLDPLFSGDGLLTMSVPDADQFDAAAVVVQPDGRILVVASAITDGIGRIVVTRLLPDGGLDLGYGNLGRFEFSLPGARGYPVDAALDAAGNLVVAGFTKMRDTDSDMVIVRVRPNGSTDPAFGSAGLALVDFGMGNDHAARVLIQPDGRIVLAGTAQQSPQSTRPALVRLQPDGTLDPAFGTGGRAAIDLHVPSRPYVGGSGAALLPDGRLVVVGVARNPDLESGQAFSVAVTPAGTVDTEFDGLDGVVLPPFSETVQGAGPVVVQPGGKVLAAFTLGADDSTQTSLGLVRYLTGPTVDLTLDFGADPPSAGPGPLQFIAVVRNAAPVPARDVRIAVTGSKKLSVEGPTAALSPSARIGFRVDVPVGTLPPEGRAEFRFMTTVTGFEGTITAHAVVTATDSDRNLGNNERFVEVLVDRNPSQ